MPEQTVREAFIERFGTEPELIAVAPGRINLIGEHTDYNDGFVFPVAIDRQVWIAASLSDRASDVMSVELGEGSRFNAADVLPGVEGWAAYPAGMAWALAQEGYEDLPNIRAVAHGSVPIGSGISSSAAIELAFGVAWNDLAGLGLDNEELAKIGQVCENRYVGVNSGIMDQMASAMGREGKAMFLDTRSLEIEYASLPPGLTIVLLDTGKPRALTDSAYNERRTQCEHAARLLGVDALRDASLEHLEATSDRMPDVIYRRARHVISENDRCRDFVAALEEGDRTSVGDLMRASHESLRYDYEVSSPELDAMAECAWDSPGVVGARMTGAGFGGACVALVDSESLEDFIQKVSFDYATRTGLEGQFLTCKAVNGARVLERL
jgi:galactokinase